MANAAQLIAHIRVTGAPKFKQDISQSEDRLERLAGTARRAGASIMGMARSLTLIGGAAIAAGGFLAKFAIDSALEFDTAQRKLQAFLGSAEEAAKTMRFIQNLAGPSLFETRDLAKAGTLLAAYGLNIQRVLPLADKLASAMGESGETVSEVARVFGRLKAGDFGEAFERLRDFGIGFDDLRKKGLQFSKSNEYLGDRLQALSAVSAIIEERFGRISEVMQTSPAAKFASAMDAIRKAAVQVGAVLLSRLVPAVEKVVQFISFLTERGEFTKLTKNLLFAFGIGGTDSTLVRGLAYVWVTIKSLPQRILQVRGAFETVFAGVGPFLRPVVAMLGFLAGARLVSGIATLVDVVWKFYRSLKAVGAAAAFASALTPGGLTKIAAGIIGAIAATVAINKLIGGEGPAANIGGALGLNDTRQEVNRIMEDFNRGQGAIGSTINAAGQLALDNLGFTKNDEELLGTNRDIEQNTRRAAIASEQMLDINRNVFGGGRLGAMGVTPAEFGAFRNSRGNRVIVEFKRGENLIESLQTAIQDALTQQRRAEGFR